MDALAIEEKTGLDFASRKVLCTPVGMTGIWPSY